MTNRLENVATRNFQSAANPLNKAIADLNAELQSSLDKLSRLEK